MHFEVSRVKTLLRKNVLKVPSEKQLTEKEIDVIILTSQPSHHL